MVYKIVLVLKIIVKGGWYCFYFIGEDFFIVSKEWSLKLVFRVLFFFRL